MYILNCSSSGLADRDCDADSKSVVACQLACRRTLVGTILEARHNLRAQSVFAISWQTDSSCTAAGSLSHEKMVVTT